MCFRHGRGEPPSRRQRGRKISLPAADHRGNSICLKVERSRMFIDEPPRERRLPRPGRTVEVDEPAHPATSRAIKGIRSCRCPLVLLSGSTLVQPGQ